MRRIGITVSSLEQGRIYGNPKAYAEAVMAAGGLPLLLPNLPEAVEDYLPLLDGLLLSGGGDIDPVLYGQENKGSQPSDPCRDRFELALTKSVAERQLPILGICRGMQLLAVAFGGTLLQDIPTALGISHPVDSDARHEAFSDSALFRDLFGESFTVNSTHHQCIDRMPDGFILGAHSPEGIPEAMDAPGRRIWGVQWHPENLWRQDDRMLSLFRLLTGA